MKPLMYLLFAAMIATPVLATAQYPDILLLEGETFSLNTNPLEAYLAANPGILPASRFASSANWRGYIARWEIREQRLLLTDVLIMCAEDDPEADVDVPGYKSVFKQMFPGREDFPAEWYTGHLIIPTGDLVHYVHMGYGSTYDRYMIATVVDGAVKRVRNVSREEFEKFRKRQFSAFRQTEGYRAEIAKILKNEGLTEEQAEEFLFGFLSERFLSIVFPESATGAETER
jgi:hypothetical protein